MANSDYYDDEATTDRPEFFFGNGDLRPHEQEMVEIWRKNGLLWPEEKRDELGQSRLKTELAWKAQGLHSPGDGDVLGIPRILPEDKQAYGESHPRPLYDLGDIRGDGLAYTVEDNTADRTIRSWLSLAELDKPIGDFIVSESKKLLKKLEKMTDAEHQLFAKKERIRLESLWKADYASNLDQVKQLVNELEEKSPGLKKFLEDSRLGDSSIIAGMLSSSIKARKSR